MTEATTPAAETAEQRAAKLVDALWADTSPAGKAVRAKAKELFPDVTTPEDTLAPVIAPMQAALEEMREKFEKAEEARQASEAARAESDAKVDMSARLNAAADRVGLTGDGLDKMVARMHETKNYTDPEAAAAWVAQQTPPTVVPKAQWGDRHLDFVGSKNKVDDELFRQLHTDPLGYQDNMLAAYAADPVGWTNESLAG